MAGSVNAGTIVYEVDMDTARLLAGRREVDAALNGLNGTLGRVEASVNRTERSLSTAGNAMTKLSGIAKGLAAALSVQQVTEYANSWINVSNKLVNAVRPTEQLSDVTQRVFDISQKTMSSLESTSALYGRLERATRTAGTSTADLTTLVTTINKGLAVSGATTEEASSTMIQLSQALASGVLRGEEFNSISENGSRLAVALADSLGVTIGQLRGMAAQGKLTTEVVVNGLLKQSGAIAKEFANTVTTMGQAFTVATNNITKFVGESSSVSSSIKVFNQNVISLSENLDVVANVITAAAAIFGGRFAGALAMATKARVDDTLAARAQAVATSNATAAAATSATVVARKALLDKEAALSSLALAQAEYNVAKGSAAEAFALQNLSAAKSLAIQRSAAYAEAQIAQAAATRTATAAAVTATATIKSLATGALALIGGPAGAAVIAAAGLFYFYQKMQQARQESIDFADKLDGVIEKMKGMSQIKLAAAIDDTRKSITAQKEALQEYQSTLEANELQQSRLRRTLGFLMEGSAAYNFTLSQLSDVESEHTQLLAQKEDAQNKLSKTVSGAGLLTAQFNGQLREGIDLLAKDAVNAGVAAGMMNQLGKMIDVASTAKEKFNASSLQVTRSDKGDKYLEKIKEENDLLAITDKRERAIAEARQKAFADGVQSNSNQLRQIEEEAARNYDLKEAEKERDKATKSATSEAKKAEKQAEKNARVLDDYRQKAELSASSTNELSREQTILAARNKLVNPTGEQVAAVERDAAAAWDKAAALKAQSAVPELKENADYSKQKEQLELLKSAKDAQGNLLISEQQYHQQSEQLEQDHQTKLAEIRANQSVTPQQDAAAKVDPVQQLANENARKLALIQQFEANKTLTQDQAEALRNATATQYEQQRIAAQWQIYRNQSTANELLASSIESFSSGASSAITGLINGTQSLSESFANLGTSVLNGVVSSLVQMGTQWVMSALMGQAAQETAIVANQATSAAALAASTAAGVASAATLLSAWSPAAMAASVASYGGAASAGMVGYTTAMTTAQTMSVAGARKNGGPVSAGSMYQVGESGKPEIFKASNGSQYMIPGDNGSVISNKDIGSSASGGTAIQQTVQFNIQTTGGIDDSTMQKMSAMMKQVSLSTIKDQQRPSGLLSKTR
ncbi:tape measure protein [Lonsdalea quercina]|uniref:tape measure protein n=1 Tax=Lonsdalea quercina TaxID=71657 RepID=UPI00397501CE